MNVGTLSRYAPPVPFATFVAMAACLLCGATVANAQVPATSLVLEGDFIRTGVSNNGTLGVGGNISPGFIFDPTGTRTFNPANDYLTPGIPQEGFSIRYGGSSTLVNNNSGNLIQIGSYADPTVVPSATSGYDNSVHWSGTIAGTMTIEHLYGLDNDSKRVEITTTITALTDLTDVRFARWIDPDSGGTNSINTRGNATLGLAPEDWVNSESEVNGATLGLYSNSEVTHNTAISPGWSTDPDDYLAGSADMVGDQTIGIAFDIGSLLNGEFISFVYYYAVAADANDFDFGGTFASQAQTPNQLAVATYLDELDPSSSTDLQSLLDDLATLTDEELLSALDQIGGAFYASLPAANLQHTTYYLSTLTSHLRDRLAPFSLGAGTFSEATPVAPSFEIQDGEIVLVGHHYPARCNSRSAWITGYGLGGTADSDGNADGFRYGLGGTQFAIEERVSDATNLGVWFNLAWSNVDGDQLDESASIENFAAGGYAVSFDGRYYTILLGGIGHDEYDTRRQISVGPVTDLADADFDGWQANAYLERGLSLARRSWVMQPYGALQYIYLRQDNFTESGGLLSLDVGALDVHSLRSILGARFSRPMGIWGRSPLSPEFRAAWIHEFLDDDQIVNAGIAGIAPTSFAVRGADLGRDWAALGTGLNLRLTRGSRLFAGYDVQVNEHQTFHVGSGGAEFIW